MTTHDTKEAICLPVHADQRKALKQFPSVHYSVDGKLVGTMMAQEYCNLCDNTYLTVKRVMTPQEVRGALEEALDEWNKKQ